MKKMILMVVAVFALAVYCPTTAQAQSYEAKTSKLLEKQLKKEYKDKLKELKKEKWQLYGSSHTLEVALLTHYDKLAKGGEDAHEVVGTATKFKSKNIGHQTAINNACNIYARQAGSHVKGRIVSDMGANSDSIVNEFDHFYGAYQTLVEKEIKGEMQESFSIIRPYKSARNYVSKSTYNSLEKLSKKHAETLPPSSAFTKPDTSYQKFYVVDLNGKVLRSPEKSVPEKQQTAPKQFTARAVERNNGR